jgi:hypothetical protein
VIREVIVDKEKETVTLVLSLEKEGTLSASKKMVLLGSSDGWTQTMVEYGNELIRVNATIGVKNR